MNVSTFLQKSAVYMAKDRPDIWSEKTAFEVLSQWFALLAGEDEGGEVSSGGFALTKRIYEEGIWEYELHRKIVQLSIFEDEGTSIFDWTTNGSIVDIGLNIQDEEIQSED